MNDRVFIEGLTFDAIIGIRPHERTTPQPLILDVEMEVDTSQAAQTNDLSLSVSYSDVARALQALVIKAEFELLETLAEHCAERVLQEQAVRSVTISARKPEAVANARSVGVTIQRRR